MFEFPALYSSASGRSAGAQKLYLRLIAGEYTLLIIAATMALDLSRDRIYFVACALVILASVLVLIFRSWRKPEQQWYSARALAESVKTTSWRYCMGAEPFGHNESDAVTRREFRQHLSNILITNRHINFSPDVAAGDQITASMDITRTLPLEERKAFYLNHRIREQRDWYVKKAKANARASRWWIVVGVGAYALAMTFVLMRIAFPDWNIWPIEPLLVVASSVVGWTQVKKFNELASSYTLTALEIGIIQTRIQELRANEAFADFVNEAEQAFSREHTQWVARQQTQ